jgi:hypothetical protein
MTTRTKPHNTSLHFISDIPEYPSSHGETNSHAPMTKTIQFFAISVGTTTAPY